MYYEKREYIKNVIKSLGTNSPICFTGDIWSDTVNRVSYFDLTMIYVDESFNLKHHLLDFRPFPERHTAENIFGIVEKISQEYSINHLTVPYVTDSGSNLKCAFKNGEWYCCFDHRLHTVVEDSWSYTLENDNAVATLFKTMNDIKAFFHKSSDLESALPTKLPSGCVTRQWTGLSNFFTAFLKSYDTILHIITTSSNLSEMPNKILLMKYAEIFQPLKPVFEKLQLSSKPTIHYVVLAYFLLKKHAQNWPSLAECYKEKFISTLKEKYRGEITQMHLLALFLHPQL